MAGDGIGDQGRMPTDSRREVQDTDDTDGMELR
jgi:hypothetical protein